MLNLQEQHKYSRCMGDINHAIKNAYNTFCIRAEWVERTLKYTPGSMTTIMKRYTIGVDYICLGRQFLLNVKCCYTICSRVKTAERKAIAAAIMININKYHAHDTLVSGRHDDQAYRSKYVVDTTSWIGKAIPLPPVRIPQLDGTYIYVHI